MKNKYWLKVKPFITPNSVLSARSIFWLFAIESGIILFLWSTTSLYYFPTPIEIIRAYGVLFSQFNLAGELMTSLSLSLEATLISFVVGLAISYCIRIPVLKLLPMISAQGRFLTLVGLTFLFSRLSGGDAHATKVLLLVFSMTVFFVTSMVSTIQQIPESEFNHARTLRMNEWRVWWEVIIIGKMDMAVVILGQCFAITWGMLTMVEVISQAGGGIGILIYSQNKVLNFDMLFAIQFLILGVGALLYQLLHWIKIWIMPYSKNN